MRVLVTGGAGFIGSHIVELLLEHGRDVAVIDNLSTGKEENVPAGARLYRVDLTSWRIQEVLATEKPEVHHPPSGPDRRPPVGGGSRAGRARSTSSGVSTCSSTPANPGSERWSTPLRPPCTAIPLSVPVAEDHPILATSPYGVSKYTVEQYLYVYRELYGLDYTVLRYANVYGPRQDPLGEGGVVAIFTHRHGQGASGDRLRRRRADPGLRLRGRRGPSKSLGA